MGDNCDLCYKALMVVDNNGKNHDVCRNERKRRVLNGFCARCGKNPITSRQSCDSCIKSGAKYKGYQCF